MSISPFTRSSRLCQLVLLCSEFEPLQFRFASYIFAISDCIFTMFLLLFFNSLVGIINRVRLADYCWSSGLKVVGLNPCWLDALIVSRVFHKSNLPYLLEARRARRYQLVSVFLVSREVSTIFPFRFVSPSSHHPQNLVPMSINLFCASQFFFSDCFSEF